MQSSVVNRLSAARQRHFVGRSTELAMLESALAEPELPFNALYIFGPGGVGKTTLLGEFAAVCKRLQIPTLTIDARNVEPSPDAIFNGLRQTLGLSPSEAPLQVLASEPSHHVILIDTYEILTPLDHWVREVLLPQLPQNVLLVLAGRNPPSTAWRSDPVWQTLIRPLPLRNLSPQESRALLGKRAIFESARTQEAVAELLDLPFSTYCHHLKSGEMRVVEALWRQEIGYV